MNKLRLKLLPNNYGICRFNPDFEIPEWAYSSTFLSITKTVDEFSIVCEENLIPPRTKCEKNWRAFKIEGPFDFALTGILSSVLSPLANAEISIFAISTYDTDYVLVKTDNLEKALTTLNPLFNINL
jgi:hypothetical protein